MIIDPRHLAFDILERVLGGGYADRTLDAALLRHPNLDPRLLGVLAVGLVSHYVPEAWYQRALGVFASLPALAQAAVLVVLALTVREMASLEAVPFVYFQF